MIWTRGPEVPLPRARVRAEIFREYEGERRVYGTTADARRAGRGPVGGRRLPPSGVQMRGGVHRQPVGIRAVVVGCGGE